MTTDTTDDTEKTAEQIVDLALGKTPDDIKAIIDAARGR